MRVPLLVLAAPAGLCLACAAEVPDPQRAAAIYADAAARGDAQAIRAMLTENAQKALSPADVAALVAGERQELGEEAAGIRARDVRLAARARLKFGDGEEVALDLHQGRFWVASAGTLPGGAATPVGALDELRRVVARRSYAGLVRILSPETRAALERDLGELVQGLERPDTLKMETHGDDASASVPGGHHVKLRREGGFWRVVDFD